MSETDPQWAANTFHSFRIALNSDALAPWQMIAVAVVTIVVALVCESRHYQKTKKPVPGFRGGVVMGLLAAISAIGPLGWISYLALSNGAMPCLLKRCGDSDFTDVRGRTHFGGDLYVSMTFDAAAFWTSYALLSGLTVLALAFLFSCIRASVHWRELD
ncbi:hypothetical protein [Dyella amyloliquefaciens]|uniref:hypothetical protein n=1 Tax=Dyella amyloliquefaciens TaxID=1770545 RepID=UPI00102E7C1B|nr:hypothetical protein [Dyella amyloliquefaciens]